MRACHACASSCMHIMHACRACMSCMSCMHVTHACRACMKCMHVMHTCHACMSCMHVMHACHACMSCMSCMHAMHVKRNRKHKRWPESVPKSGFVVQFTDCSPWPGRRPVVLFSAIIGSHLSPLCSIYPRSRLLNPSPGDVLSGAIFNYNSKIWKNQDPFKKNKR